MSRLTPHLLLLALLLTTATATTRTRAHLTALRQEYISLKAEHQSTTAAYHAAEQDFRNAVAQRRTAVKRRDRSARACKIRRSCKVARKLTVVLKRVSEKCAGGSWRKVERICRGKVRGLSRRLRKAKGLCERLGKGGRGFGRKVRMRCRGLSGALKGARESLREVQEAKMMVQGVHAELERIEKEMERILREINLLTLGTPYPRPSNDPIRRR